LQRQVPGSYGNDPANWFVAAPTPGKPNTINPTDTNGDGLPDAWQVQYFGSISAPQAAPKADPDGDAFTNLEEFLAGTDPTDRGSLLKIDAVQATQIPIVILFKAIAGKTYTVLSSSNLDGGWVKVADVSAQPSTAVVSVTDPRATAGATQFYRLVTPSAL
jgi:hypothetical protein